MRTTRSIAVIVLLAALLGALHADQRAATWAAMPLPVWCGDSWDGNAVSDGQRLYLVSRENVHRFWGAIRVRSSDDGGLTWSAPGAASLGDAPTSARPTIALGPDGAVWVAFARRGLLPATQSLMIGRSTDRGATWPVLARASPVSIGLVGLPVLLITPDVRLAAYTDGVSGATIVQLLGPDGRPDGMYSVLGNTTRLLYSDSDALDAGIALAAIGRHVVALWHATDRRLEVSLSDDAGRSWRGVAPLSITAAWARPKLLVSDGRIYALVDQTSGSAYSTWLELASSSDGGVTWEHGPPLSNGLWSRDGVVSRAGGSWILAYSACVGVHECTTGPQIWYRSSMDGRHWTDPEALTEPGNYYIVGAGMTAGRAWAIWWQSFSASDEDRALGGATR